MTSRYYPQWRDENAVIDYPFNDGSTLTDTSGQLYLTFDWLIDAAIYSPIAIAPVHISRITIDGNEAFVYLQDQFQQDIGVGIVDRLSGNPIAVRDAENQPVATLVPSYSNNSAIFSLGDGDFFFDPTAAEFVASCVLQAPQQAVSGFAVGDDQLVSANLILVGERGIQLTVEPVDEIDVNGNAIAVQLVRVHALGDPQALTRQCDDISRRPTQFIRELVFQFGDTTHICSPDNMGNVLLLAESESATNSALKITSQVGEIRFQLAGRSI